LSLGNLQSEIGPFLVLGAWDVGFLGEPSNTSKALDKYVVVRVILHGQCSLQRKEAIRLKQLLKAIMIVAVLATALSFGACAQKKETVTTSAGTTGYSK
jgi:hypothetical protein